MTRPDMRRAEWTVTDELTFLRHLGSHAKPQRWERHDGPTRRLWLLRQYLMVDRDHWGKLERDQCRTAANMWFDQERPDEC